MNEMVKVLDQQVVLGKQFRIYGTAESPLFLAKDVADWIDYSDGNSSHMCSMVDPDEVVKIFCYIEGRTNGTKPEEPKGLAGLANRLFLTEDGFYEVLMQSRMPIAKKFKKEVKAILKSIRKHGAYMTPITIERVTQDPDFLIGLLQNLKEEQTKRKELEKQAEHKQSVIEGLTEDISLAEKRQRITQIVRHGSDGNYKDRYTLLYKEFERKHHIDLDRRMKSEKAVSIKPKIKNKMDYIERAEQMIPELYNLACKLFEGSFEQILRELQ